MTTQRQVSNEPNQSRKTKMATSHNRNMNNDTNDSQSTPPPPPCQNPSTTFVPQNEQHTTAVSSSSSSSSSNPLPCEEIKRNTPMTNEPHITNLRVSESVTSDTFTESRSQGVQLSYYRSLSATPPNVSVQNDKS